MVPAGADIQYALQPSPDGLAQAYTGGILKTTPAH